MKKLLLLVVAVAITFGGFAQKGSSQISKELYNKSVKLQYQPNVDEAINMSTNVMVAAPNEYVSSKLSIEETVIGKTFYDLQTNSVHGERAYMAPDGQMAAVWTMGFDNPGFADRGTGYNFFDGSSWGAISEERIDVDYRSGWPSIAMWGDGEVFTSHANFDAATGSFDHLGIFTRPERGTGEWTVHKKASSVEDNIEYLWNRLATSGENHDIIHVISNAYTDGALGQNKAVLYNRSTDGGATWDVEDVVLEGTGPDFYTGFNGDGYKIVTNGNTVCVIYVDPVHDLFYLRSDDNGDTWAKTVVWEHPYPMFDDNTITTDTVWAPDGSLDAVIDNDGKLHLTFPLTRILKTEAGAGFNYFPYTDGLVYWNEDMPAFENENQHYALKDEFLGSDQLVAWTPDVNNDGVYGVYSIPDGQLHSYRSLGMATMPSIDVDNDGNLFIVYAAPNEDRVFQGEDAVTNFHQVFGVGKKAGDVEWSQIAYLSSDFLHSWDEIIYPYIIGVDDEYVHMFVSIDLAPGLGLDEDHDYGENKQVYWKVSKDEFISDISVETNESVINSISQNYPNPASGATVIDVNVAESATATIEVINMVGQKVFETSQDMNAGTNTVQLNVADYASGVYFYTVTIGNAKETRKMIVE